MDPDYDYKRFAILYVDDEEKSLKYLVRAFEDQFRILTASNARQGLELLQQQADSIGLLMTDQRMPGERGTWLLQQARQVAPRVVRILATAYADMEAAISAVNTGAIYKYVTKPWDPPQLEATLKRGLEFFIVQRERDQLLKERVTVLQNLMAADRVISLGLLASGLSHHIRNALVGVKTFLDLTPSKLAEEGIDPARSRHPDFWQDYYASVQGHLEKIIQMLVELNACAEVPPYVFKDRVRLRAVIDNVLQRLQPRIKELAIEVRVEIPSDLPEMTVDAPRFARMFELLFKDELVSLPRQGCITCRAAADPQAPGGGFVRVTLQDNGPGLPPETLKLIFDPFLVRTDAPSEYGINLMAAYFLAHHHGGRLEAQSEKGQGTTFVLRLPVNASQPVAPPEKPELMQQALLNEALWERVLRAP